MKPEGHESTGESTPVTSASQPSRRRLLAGAAILAGVAAESVASSGAATAAPTTATTTTPPTFDVATYGAKGNGTTDDTLAIQRAIDAAAAAKPGGGTVQFGSGTYLTRQLTIRSNVTLLGAGMTATVLKHAGGTADLIRGGAQGAEIGFFTLQSLTLDGAGNGGRGINVWGVAWSALDICVANFRGVGIQSAHTVQLTAGTSSIEARLTSCVVHHNLGGGIQWNGPHDSIFTGLTVFLNGPDSGSTTSGIATDGESGNGITAVSCHVWGINHRYAFYLGGNAQLTSCQAEGASDAQIVILADSTSVFGGYAFAGTIEPRPGIRIGGPGARPAGTQIISKTTNCNPALDFVNDAGNGEYHIQAWQPENTAFMAGTPAPHNRMAIQAAGPGSGDTFSTRSLSNAQIGGGWSNVGGDAQPAGFHRDGSHIVHLRGMITGGAQGADVFQLPYGFRPAHRLSLPAFTYDVLGTSMGRVDVLPDGWVRVLNTRSTVSLEGITFPSEG